MKGVVEKRLLGRASLVGVVLESLLVLASHYRPWVRDHFLLFGAMMIAGTAGLLYARDLAGGFAKGALGGLVIGAACGLSAVGLFNVTGGAPETHLPYGVMVMTLAGMAGGFFGQIDAIMRAFFKSLQK